MVSRLADSYFFCGVRGHQVMLSRSLKNQGFLAPKRAESGTFRPVEVHSRPIRLDFLQPARVGNWGLFGPRFAGTSVPAKTVAIIAP
jgi:hypothetical protein